MEPLAFFLTHTHTRVSNIILLDCIYSFFYDLWTMNSDTETWLMSRDF